MTSLRYKNELVDALLKEIILQKDYLAGEMVETIYFGGGTPSLCSKEELNAVIAALKANFPVSESAEITLEANPDDITAAHLEQWKAAGVNRLSIGIQSFFEEDLQWMNRAHSAQQARDNLSLARQYFDNITIDLIYGTPGLSNEKWKQNVTTAISFGIPHLSCYALTVEPKTPLDKMIHSNKSADVDPAKQSEQFLLLMQWLEEAGYEHYEISNFALPGWRSRHNSSYWIGGEKGQGKKYLGLGPSAHSFNGRERQWNVSNNQQYIEAIDAARSPFEKEVLTETQRLNEYIMTSLRLKEGIHLSLLSSAFGIAEQTILQKAKKFIDNDLLYRSEDALILTKEGKLLADGIASDLFF